MNNMPEEIKLRMSKATPDQVNRVREWFQKLEELLDDEKTDSSDYGRWISAHYQEVADDWERILMGYDVLIENACDKSLSYLDFKPEIKTAITMASGVGELIDAAEKVYSFKDAMTTDGPRALILALAMIDLHKAAEKLKQGRASKPSSGQNPEHSA